MAFSRSVIDLLPFNRLIKEVIGNLVIDSEKLVFFQDPLSMRKIMEP